MHLQHDPSFVPSSQSTKPLQPERLFNEQSNYHLFAGPMMNERSTTLDSLYNAQEHVLPQIVCHCSAAEARHRWALRLAEQHASARSDEPLSKWRMRRILGEPSVVLTRREIFRRVRGFDEGIFLVVEPLMRHVGRPESLIPELKSSRRRVCDGLLVERVCNEWEMEWGWGGRVVGGGVLFLGL
ncbi:uncharacterized protein A4U43_C04F5300 [Asparagus officinalis]|uniref:Uncharacterized protein n=1 Tax=Asparagus officinalis TaxID=4686 RepID=A0A5P1F2X5_ASPOF|nr:uncharacterized protein A4U43_C04F5300 [Asparagus officinalis]